MNLFTGLSHIPGNKCLATVASIWNEVCKSGERGQYEVKATEVGTLKEEAKNNCDARKQLIAKLNSKLSKLVRVFERTC